MEFQNYLKIDDMLEKIYKLYAIQIKKKNKKTIKMPTMCKVSIFKFHKQ